MLALSDFASAQRQLGEQEWHAQIECNGTVPHLARSNRSAVPEA